MATAAAAAAAATAGWRWRRQRWRRRRRRGRGRGRRFWAFLGDGNPSSRDRTVRRDVPGRSQKGLAQTSPIPNSPPPPPVDSTSLTPRFRSMHLPGLSLSRRVSALLIRLSTGQLFSGVLTPLPRPGSHSSACHGPSRGAICYHLTSCHLGIMVGLTQSPNQTRHLLPDLYQQPGTFTTTFFPLQVDISASISSSYTSAG